MPVPAVKLPWRKATDSLSLNGLIRGESNGPSCGLAGGNDGSLAFGQIDLTGARSVRLHYAAVDENDKGWTIRLETADGKALAAGTIGSGDSPAKPQSTVLTIQNGTLIKDLRVSIRSEEHTSELQSLMRISYAVFCLKKKTNTQ